jgi:hypothetical protein
LLQSAPQRSTQWPVVQRLDQSFTISDPNRAVVKTFILGTHGESLYLFICRTGDDESVSNVNYAGDIDCRLIPAELGEVERNLLVEAPNLSAWYSRGRMFARELQADCATYPEYGRERHFRLRGLRLTMNFDDLRFAPPRADGSPRLASYILRLRVDPDATARGSIAESSGYLDPGRQLSSAPRSCSMIRKGNEWAP